MVASERPKRRPHIVHLCANLREGGAEALVRQLAPQLIEAGLDVTLISVYGSRLDENEKSALGVPVVEIGRTKRADYGYFPRLVGALRALKPDIVHTHLHTGKYAGRVAALAAHVPSIVFTEHGDEHPGAIKTLFKRILNPRTARFVVFTESQRAAFGAAEHVPIDRISVIPNGIAPSTGLIDRTAVRRELGLEPTDFALFLPARLAAQKNQRLALDALVQSRSQRLRLVLAGDGPDRATIESFVRENGLRDRVRILGFRHDVRRLAGAMDAYVLASRWERMPLALGEAMMDRLPVISTPWEGVDDFITDGETGYLARGFTPMELAAAYDRAVTDDALRERIRENAERDALARFDLRRTARAHADLYNQLLSK